VDGRTALALATASRPAGIPRGRRDASAAHARLVPSAVNPLADERNGPLIDRGGIPSLDRREIGFPRLVARACAPAMGLEEICRRGQGGGSVVEASGAVVQDALGQELSETCGRIRGST
jgi:hypothetical protein